MRSDSKSHQFRPQEDNPFLPARRAVSAKIFFAAITGWIYKGTAIICNLINISLLFRYLEKEVLGVWILMLGAQAFLGLFDFGFGQTLQRRIAFLKAEHASNPAIEPDFATQIKIQSLINLARRTYALISILAFLIVLFMGWIYFNNLKIGPSALSEARVALIIMALGYAANTWGFMIEATLNGVGDIGWSNLVNSVAQVVTLIANWCVLSAGFGLYSLSLIWLFKGLFIRFGGLALLRIRHKWINFRGSAPNLAALKEMVPPSIRWWLALLGYFMMTGIGQYLIGRYLGAAALPDYAATYMALAAIQGALVGVVSAGSPLYSQLYRAGETAHVREVFLLLIRECLGALVMIYSLAIVWGKDIMGIWLGKGHFVGNMVFYLLVGLMVLEANQGMLQVACAATEKMSFYKAVLVGGVLALGLSMVLIPRMGILGAALSTFIGEVSTQHWYTPMLAMRVLRIKFVEYLKRVLLPVSLSGSILAILGFTIKAADITTPVKVLLTLVCGISVSLIFYRNSLVKLLYRSKIIRKTRTS